MPWLRGLVAGLSPCKPEFGPRPLIVEFVVHGVALYQVYFAVTSAFHCHCHSDSWTYSCCIYRLL